MAGNQSLKRCPSASATMRAIISTASRGYLPTAVSPDSITASVPSKMALATSLASARVGRGFSIIDSSICVAVITGRRKSSARRIMRFWISGTFSGAHLHAQIATRHHHAVWRLPEWHRDSRPPAAFPAWRSAERHYHARRWRCSARITSSAVRTNEIAIASTPLLQSEIEIGFILLRKRRNADFRPRQVDPLMLAQHAAIQHPANHVAIDDLP